MKAYMHFCACHECFTKYFNIYTGNRRYEQKLGLALLIMTVSASTPLYIRRRLPFSAGPCSFPDGWPSLLSLSLLLFGPHSDFLGGSHVLLEAFRHVSNASRFLPPFHRGSYLRSGLALYSLRMPFVLPLVAQWGVIGFPRMSRFSDETRSMCVTV